MKRCNICKRLLDKNEFNQDRSRKDGLRYDCRICQSARNSAQYDSKVRATQYRLIPEEKRRERRRQYNKLHIEEGRIRDKQWALANPQKCREKTNRYRARKARLPADLTGKEWLEILKYYGHACAYCGKIVLVLHQEHVIPVAQGGGYTKANIVPACPSCNYRKGNKTPEEAGMKFVVEHRVTGFPLRPS